MTEEERCEVIRHCRYVDEVYRCPPFLPTLSFVEAIRADLVAHDSLPYSCPVSEDCYAEFKQANRFLPTKRTPSVSTTELMVRIFDNLELFRGKARPIGD